MRGVGWILDVYIDNKGANLWVKLDNGEVIHLTDEYRPDFYVELRDEGDPEDMIQFISLHPDVFEVGLEEMYTSILNREKSEVLHVFTCDTPSFRTVRNDLERLDIVKSWFNVDICHFQRYLFSKHFAPTSKIRVEWSERRKLVDVTVIDDSCEIEPPPFSSLLFEVGVESRKLTPTAWQDPIKMITLQNGENGDRILNGPEDDVLTGFASHVSALDPDFLVTDDCEETLRYILDRSKTLDIDLQLGREPIKSYNLRRVNSAVRGRALIDTYAFLEYGVAGICEFSRFTLAPPIYSARWPAGKRIDARQSFEALRKGLLIPKRRAYPRFSMSAREIHENDKGGLLFSPVVGLHENVAELDFESMFPQIIIHHNISYETVTPTHVDRSKQGFLGEVVKVVLDRRLHFKHLCHQFPKNSVGYRWCDQRQKALKCLLVCIYGFSGCFANRFNNVAVYNMINAMARRILIQTVNICLSRGFEVLYGNTDSIFVKRPEATGDDYEGLAREIRVETGLPISLDSHYRFIVFMRQHSRPDVEAMNHFYGRLIDGGFKSRGIELRRRDCPAFIKEFQKKLIEILFDADCERELLECQVAKAEVFVHGACGRIMSGGVDSSKLVISKRVRKDVKAYNTLFPHVVAARHLVQWGKRLDEGATVEFVYTNAGHTNPMRRVLPLLLIDGERSHYDREKYRNMILDAAESVLSPFGFSRRQYGLRQRVASFQQMLLTCLMEDVEFEKER